MLVVEAYAAASSLEVQVLFCIHVGNNGRVDIDVGVPDLATGFKETYRLSGTVLCSANLLSFTELKGHAGRCRAQRAAHGGTRSHVFDVDTILPVLTLLR